VEIDDHGAGDGMSWTVGCIRCGAQGPIRQTIAEATAGWSAADISVETAFTAFERIEAARECAGPLEDSYLRHFGWAQTCNAPGSFWIWRRDFAVEDAERHRRWKERGPGPMGWPSEPRPYGVITAPRELAVLMTAQSLDPHPRTEGDDDD
jgi:hypothetical protein